MSAKKTETAPKAPAKKKAAPRAGEAKAPAKAKKQPAAAPEKEANKKAEEQAMEIKKETAPSPEKAGVNAALEIAQEIAPQVTAPQPPPLKVLFVASECAPFVKTGGLADVVGALPAVLKKKGVDVRVMLPLYSAIGQQYRSQMTYVTNFYVPMGWRSQYCGIMTMEKDGVIYYFLDNEYYFGRSYIYGECNNEEGERFAFFSKAALDALRHVNFYPDVLHAHDWQAAMTIALLRMQYSNIWEYRDIATMYTIHNLRYQGIFGWEHMNDVLNIDKASFNPDTIEYFEDVNFTKGALSFADAITTVSPTYAREIQTPEYGENLDGLLRKRSWDVHGIL
ncbi:MAG: glycogen/starch synthase, partial [Clostridia bacterium]|nr:glycogen/starch synthase [Clostridia bacterium]